MGKYKIRLRTEVYDALARGRGWRTGDQQCAALGISRAQLNKIRAHTAEPGPRFTHAVLTGLRVPYETLFERVEVES